jgi:predicted DsbA family dithiol-disulfide isomerase
MLQESGALELGLHRPGIVPWTRKAHELVAHASEAGSPAEIHESLFRNYLIDGRDIGRVDVLVQLAGEHGLDRVGSKAVLDVDRHTDAVEEFRRGGLRAGVTRVPTLRLGEKLLPGNPTPEALSAFLDSGADRAEP